MKSLTLLAFVPIVAGAQTVYDYQGAAFETTTLSSTNTTSLQTPTFPYTTDEAISGSMDLSAPLTPNLNSAIVDPLSFSFSSGNGFSTAGGSLHSSIVPQTASFIFSTDGQGNITVWAVDITATEPGTNSPISLAIHTTPQGDTSATEAHSLIGSSNSSASGPAGAWSTVAPVPEITAPGAAAAFTLLAGMLAILQGWGSVVSGRRLRLHVEHTRCSSSPTDNGRYAR